MTQCYALIYVILNVGGVGGDFSIFAMDGTQGFVSPPFEPYHVHAHFAWILTVPYDVPIYSW